MGNVELGFGAERPLQRLARRDRLFAFARSVRSGGRRQARSRRALFDAPAQTDGQNSQAKEEKYTQNGKLF
jgi:hypothetical protein